MNLINNKLDFKYNKSSILRQILKIINHQYYIRFLLNKINIKPLLKAK